MSIIITNPAKCYNGTNEAHRFAQAVHLNISSCVVSHLLHRRLAVFLGHVDQIYSIFSITQKRDTINEAVPAVLKAAGYAVKIIEAVVYLSLRPFMAQSPQLANNPTNSNQRRQNRSYSCQNVACAHELTPSRKSLGAPGNDEHRTGIIFPITQKRDTIGEAVPDTTGCAGFILKRRVTSIYRRFLSLTLRNRLLSKINSIMASKQLMTVATAAAAINSFISTTSITKSRRIRQVDEHRTGIILREGWSYYA